MTGHSSFLASFGTPNATTITDSESADKNFFSFSAIFFPALTIQGFSDYVRPRMRINERVKTLLKEAKNGKEKLRLSQICLKCGVDYDRVWRFMNPAYPDYLQAEDAQKIIETLSDKPLFQDANV